MAVGCSSSDGGDVTPITDSGSTSDARTDADAATETCTGAGGICIALAATANCPDGRSTPTDPAIRCAGAGAMCCVPSPQDASTDARGDADAPVNACVAKGGTCIAVTPSAMCPSGTHSATDACDGVGASCCLPDGDAGPDAATD